jgi:hypothetical protein
MGTFYFLSGSVHMLFAASSSFCFLALLVHLLGNFVDPNKASPLLRVPLTGSGEQPLQIKPILDSGGSW